MKEKRTKILPYFAAPLLYCLIGFAVLFMAAAPILDILKSVGGAFVLDEEPVFSETLSSVFEEPEIENPEKQPGSIPLESVHWPEYGEQYGRLECTDLGLNSPVYYGDSDEILTEGAGQSMSSAIPGYGSSILISAHNLTYFLPLKDAKEGDVITFTTSYGVYTYKINKIEVSDSQNSEAYNLLKEKEELILYTCYPFDILSANQQERIFIYAEKTAGPDLK